jgi:hypothetical protein
MVAADSYGDRQEHGRPRVFVSYAHDDDDHKGMVRRFATFLTGRGIWVDLDVWSNKKRQDWAGWATARMTRADYVLVIASARYRLVADGDADGDVHRGAQYEARILRDRLYGDPDTWRQKILPVVLPGHAVTEVPVFLEPYTNTHFVIGEIDDAGIDELLRVLTGQPRDMRPSLGPLPELGPHESTREPDATRTDDILDVDGGLFNPTVPIEERLDRLDLVLAEVEANEREARRWPAADEPHILGARSVVNRARELRVRVTILRSGARIDPMDPRLLAPLRARELAVDEALRQARDDRDQREALWGEWAELRRKLRTYKARTVPIWAEDVEFAGLYDIARNCLWHQPCDLGATGIAVENYAEAIRRRLGIVREEDSQ